MATPESKLIAKMILAAGKMREDSYDQTEADEKSKKVDEGILPWANYNDCYKLSQYDACVAVCKAEGHEEFADLIHSLLIGSWNESHQWANDQK